MKIPVEWLKQYITTNKSTKSLADSFTALGLLLDKPVEKYKSGSYTTDVLDLEHRMDRSDWLSILGCARDLAAFEGISLKYPELSEKNGKKPTKDQIVDIQVNCPDLVNRFTTVVFRGVKVKKSPAWLKNRLEAYGIPSKNNIVDITNYVMVELGQTMHAQDLDKMEAQEIVIRNAKKGEKVTTLLGETVQLEDDQFVLTQKDKATVIGGIVGGITTAVDEKTTDIVLDAGNYNQNNIRKSSRKLKIQNESVLRNDKFVNPELTEIAIKRATKLILELAGGELYENIDWYPTKTKAEKKKVRFERIKMLSGMEIDKNTVKSILENLEYKILKTTDDYIEVEIPYFRTDIDVEDDLVADILRINNYAKVPLALIDKAPPAEVTPAIYKCEDELRNICVNLGLHEHVTDPLVSLEGKGTDAVELENALSSEKNCLRTSVYETLFPVTVSYLKAGYASPKVFEIGKTYHKNANYQEKRVLEVIIGGDASPQEKSKEIKRLLSGVLSNLGIETKYKKEGKNTAIIHGKTTLGALKYDSFSLYTEELMPLKTQQNRVVTKQRDAQTDDLSLIMDVAQPLGEIYEKLSEGKGVSRVSVHEDSLRKINREDKRTVLLRIEHTKDWDRDKAIKELKIKYKVLLRA